MFRLSTSDKCYLRELSLKSSPRGTKKIKLRIYHYVNEMSPSPLEKKSDAWTPGPKQCPRLSSGASGEGKEGGGEGVGGGGRVVPEFSCF
jgi:hypothetical protein